MRLTRQPIAQLLIAGFVVHASVLVAASVRTGRIDGYAFRSLDCGEFYRIAQNVAEYGVFSQSDDRPLQPDTWRTPGYPLFLAVFIFMFGDSPSILVVVQQLLCMLNVLLVFRIAGEWMSTRWALIAACLFLLEPYHLFYSLWLMSTTLFVTVLLLTWLVWLRALRARRLLWFLLLGALSGFLVLVRPVGGLIPIALLAGLVVAAVRFKHRDASELLMQRRWAALPAFMIVCAVVVGSWMMRNQITAGQFALSDQGGVVLAYFKATEVILWREGRTAERYLETTLDPDSVELPHTVWDEIDSRLQSRFAHLPEDQRAALRWRNIAQGNRTAADSFVVSKALSEIGWSYLVASPLTTVVCGLVRCGSILTFPLDLALKPPVGVDVGRFAPVLNVLKGGVYLLLCLWVLVRLFRGGLSFEQIYFPILSTIGLLLATTPQLDPRFRVPMIPLLIVVALLPRRTAPS